MEKGIMRIYFLWEQGTNGMTKKLIGRGRKRMACYVVNNS